MMTDELMASWLNNPPETRSREHKAFELLTDACQLLHAAVINLGHQLTDLL